MTLKFLKKLSFWPLLSVLPLVKLLFFLFLGPLPVQATTTTSTSINHLIFINQVRGPECCQPGSQQFLEQQINKFIELKLPAFFALRYDAITDPEFATYLNHISQTHPDLIKFGLFLEITPQLAQAAGVSYQANETNWYQAQYAYSIGYSPADRQKLIDTLMEQFKHQFGFYPQFTSGWIIDTPTLNYLHDQYQVTFHQITREQWGTDSYTLYGGPPHYPYPASHNWAFNPDYNQDQPLMIVRQTLTDPVHNYGDQQSLFTSQPNDYSQDGKTLQYFQFLLDQAFHQPADQTGWAVLGLENSMPTEYQTAFLDQLTYVHSQQNQQNSLISDVEEIISLYKDTKISIYYGKDSILDSNTEIVWVSTPNYRLRLVAKDDQVSITDWHLYSNQLQDPYSKRSAQEHAYWITPFVIDSSRFFSSNNPTWQNILNWSSIKAWWKEYGLNPRSDLLTKNTFSLKLPAKNPESHLEFSRDEKSIQISYSDLQAETVNLVFLDQDVTIKPIKSLTPPHLPNHLPGEKEGIFLNISCDEQNSTCHIQPHLDPQKFQASWDQIYPYYFPETRYDVINPDQTQIFAHNQYAIAGRNPVRVVLIAKNDQGFPTTITDQPVLTTSTQIESSSNLKKLLSGVYFVDLENSYPVATTLEVSFPQQNLTKKQTVFFAPNCRQQFKYCVFHPIQAWWYLNTVVRDKLRPYRE